MAGWLGRVAFGLDNGSPMKVHIYILPRPADEDEGKTCVKYLWCMVGLLVGSCSIVQARCHVW